MGSKKRQEEGRRGGDSKDARSVMSHKWVIKGSHDRRRGLPGLGQARASVASRRGIVASLGSGWDSEKRAQRSAGEEGSRRSSQVHELAFARQPSA